MPRQELEGPQLEHVRKGLKELLDRKSQKFWAERWGITQQAVSDNYKKPSMATATKVARALGVTYEDLVDHGRLKPREGQGTPMRTLPDWETALSEAKKMFAGKVPEWCWEQAGEWITQSPPDRVTPLSVWNLAEAILNNRPAELAEESDTKLHQQALAKEPRGDSAAIQRTFGSSGAGTTVQRGKIAPSKRERAKKLP